MEVQAAAAMSAVLDNDDLLLRVGFPNILVRAALVCKRWLRLASAPAFLRQFHHLHPPHLLGFYVTAGTNSPRFVPMPQPPELASVLRRASFDLDTMGSDRLDVYCSNGLLIICFWGYSGGRAIYTRRVRCPLYPARDLAILPPLPRTSIHDGKTYYSLEIIPNGGGYGLPLPYLCLAIGCKEQQSVLDLYVLQDNIWAIYTSAVTEIRRIELLLSCLIVDDRIYNLAHVDGTYKLVSLNLSSSCLSLVNLPEEVEWLQTDLSLENDSEVHLIHVKGSQLRIWLYMVDNNGLANWLLVNAICLHDICANHMIPTSIFENVGDPGLVVDAAGVNSGLFFLERDDVLYLFDIKRKTAKKVFKVTQEGAHLHQIRPFMMVWPPKFPVMKEECDPNE
ncbi:hypothetical protein ACQ4PT_057027 [Festuca glaucescens]